MFNQETNLLKPRCITALKRIFILSDHNMDGILGEAELNELQVSSYSLSYVSYRSS